MTRLLTLTLLMFAVGSAHAAEKTLDKTFAVSSGGTLMVEADSASVQVSGSGGNQVVVRMRVGGNEKDLAKVELAASETNGNVMVTMKRQGEKSWLNWGSWSAGGNIEVTVPRNYSVNVSTSGGSIELRSTSGQATLRSSGGDISARGITGDLEARTSGGGISVDELRGDLNASTSGGDLRLFHVDGKIAGRTSGGSVHCSLVGANRGITAKTSGGSIELTLPRATTGELAASTSGGNVSSELPVSNSRKSETHLDGPINGGGELIELRTSGGSINVRAAN